MTAECNWCTLKVDNEGMHALMCLTMPSEEAECNINEKMVTDFISSQGIIYGISLAAVSAIVTNVQYGQYVCVAQGKAAVRGQDGYFKYEKNTHDMKKKPLIASDGTADYKNSLNLATIQQGELLATYIKPTEGEAGIDIYGQSVKSPGNGKDLLPLRGKGIVADEEKMHFYAEYSGHIVMDGSKIYIDKLFRVDGDLDIEVGNIRFDGDVEVCGDVRSGLEIDTKGSIFIHGHVGACKLTAGDNITIEKGIQGRDSCYISAKGDVACKFVERCTINASGNIYADSILDSVVIADKQVIVTSKTGNVVGGEIYGKTGVVVKDAGNSAGAPTLIRCGLPREEYARAAYLSEQISEIDGKIASFNHHLEAIEVNISDKNQVNEVKTKIMRAKIVLNSQKAEYTEELSALKDRIAEDSKHSFIDVLGVVYEGVRIYIGAYPYIVNEAFKEVTYMLHNNVVIASDLVKHEDQGE